MSTNRLTFWWLSFADPERPKGEQFLGVVIMPGKSDDDEGMKHALEGTHLLRCNPGGEVQGMPLPPAMAVRLPPGWVGRILSREECDQFDREVRGCLN